MLSLKTLNGRWERYSVNAPCFIILLLIFFSATLDPCFFICIFISVQLHAELCYAECLLERALLTFIQVSTYDYYSVFHSFVFIWQDFKMFSLAIAMEQLRLFMFLVGKPEIQDVSCGSSAKWHVNLWWNYEDKWRTIQRWIINILVQAFLLYSLTLNRPIYSWHLFLFPTFVFSMTQFYDG